MNQAVNQSRRYRLTYINTKRGGWITPNVIAFNKLIMCSSHSDPKSVVIAFALDYTTWEQAMNSSDDAFENQSLREQHRDILLRYCTLKERKFVDGSFSFSDPPTYGMVTEDNIVSIEFRTSTRVYVDTKQLNRTAYRFVLLRARDAWRIDSVKWWTGKEWKNTLIGS